MDRRRWRRLRTWNLVPLLGIALLVTGCGDSSEDEVAGGHDAVVSTPVEVVDGEPVTVEEGDHTLPTLVWQQVEVRCVMFLFCL